MCLFMLHIRLNQATFKGIVRLKMNENIPNFSLKSIKSIRMFPYSENERWLGDVRFKKLQ